MKALQWAFAPSYPRGYLLPQHSRLSRSLAHAAFLQMSNERALEFGLPAFAAAAFVALLRYVTFSDGSPGLWPGALFPIEKQVSPCSFVG